MRYRRGEEQKVRGRVGDSVVQAAVLELERVLEDRVRGQVNRCVGGFGEHIGDIEVPRLERPLLGGRG